MRDPRSQPAQRPLDERDQQELHPVVDRTYPLEEVREAMPYVETEQKTGNVVITVAR